ncbi:MULTISPECIES: alpha/beta hydrolase [unclassified Falsihalocynthiibacter]|uniref:alpha/beta hydrolase n=1 Tax=unclassified Falsihalocynthiibacter TaxID=2854191 RepID=UPI00350FCECB
MAASRRIAGGVSRVGNEDVADLEKLGVTVINLSDVADAGGSLNHDKFAASPEVVQLIGQHMLEGNSLSASSGSTVLGSARTNTVSAFGATVTNAISE